MNERIGTSPSGAARGCARVAARSEESFDQRL